MKKLMFRIFIALACVAAVACDSSKTEADRLHDADAFGAKKKINYKLETDDFTLIVRESDPLQVENPTMSSWPEGNFYAFEAKGCSIEDVLTYAYRNTAHSDINYMSTENLPGRQISYFREMRFRFENKSSLPPLDISFVPHYKTLDRTQSIWRLDEIVILLGNLLSFRLEMKGDNTTIYSFYRMSNTHIEDFFVKLDETKHFYSWQGGMEVECDEDGNVTRKNFIEGKEYYTTFHGFLAETARTGEFVFEEVIEFDGGLGGALAFPWDICLFPYNSDTVSDSAAFMPAVSIEKRIDYLLEKCKEWGIWVRPWKAPVRTRVIIFDNADK